MRVAQVVCAAALAVTLHAGAEVVSFPNVAFSDAEQPRTISGVLTKVSAPGAHPAVVLLHTCGGLGPHVLNDWPAFLASLGYVSLAVDSFGSRGIKRCPTPLSKDHSELTRDVFGALNYLATMPFVDNAKIAVMGFSLGGNTIDYFLGQSLQSPSGRSFKAAVNVYGRCSNLRSAKAAIPTLVLIGDREHDTRLLPCKALAQQARSFVKVHVLPNTYHGFDQQQVTTIRNDSSGNQMLYSNDATQRSRDIIKEFLAEHFQR